jgi:hypothetical protein
MFTAIMNVPAVSADAEKVAFLEHEIELLDRKSSSPKKPTKTQLENDVFKTDILSFLTEADAPKSIKELQAGVPSIGGLTNQRITHLLTDLRKDEKIVREYVKKVPYFSIAA